MGTKMMDVCDQCDRPPNGYSPDSMSRLRCGHEICNECDGSNHRHGFLPCRVCFDKAHPGVTMLKVRCPACGRKTYGYNWHADADGKLVRCGFCGRAGDPEILPDDTARRKT
jgi:ribosomal protein S27E